MKAWRYQIREEVEIEASVEQVYAVAADPRMVPAYAPEIARIDVVKRLSDNIVLVRSHLKIARLTFACLYRHHHRPPTHYSGIEVRGRLFRGYFSLTFRPLGQKTLVSHTEGITSSIPGLARIIGLVYFRILARGGLGEELQRLKHLVESGEKPGGSFQSGRPASASPFPYQT
jgi:hypothetical protein